VSSLAEEVVPGPLHGCVIKVGLGGAIAEVVGFFLITLLSFGSFVLVAKRSSLATWLAAMAPKLSEPNPYSTITKVNSEMRGKGEVFFGGTWVGESLPDASAALVVARVEVSRWAIGGDDR